MEASPYTIQTNHSIQIFTRETTPLFHCAVNRLEYLAKKFYQANDGKAYYNFEKEFDEWVDKGMIGLYEQEVQNYLKDNPFRP